MVACAWGVGGWGGGGVRMNKAGVVARARLPPPPPHTPIHPHTPSTRLQIPQLDPIQVEHREGVGGGKAQQAQDLEHLHCGHLHTRVWGGVGWGACVAGVCVVRECV